MEIKKAYVGLGGNIGDVALTLMSALRAIRALKGVLNVRSSRFYKTTPVSSIAQDSYINAVCEVETTLSVKEFFLALEHIEKAHGKVFKPKDAPRAIDLDLLFFGTQAFDDGSLCVPHPAWNQRLFVMTPLLDLIQVIEIEDKTMDISEHVKTFANTNQETIILLQ